MRRNVLRPPATLLPSRAKARRSEARNLEGFIFVVWRVIICFWIGWVSFYRSQVDASIWVLWVLGGATFAGSCQRALIASNLFESCGFIKYKETDRTCSLSQRCRGSRKAAHMLLSPTRKQMHLDDNVLHWEKANRSLRRSRTPVRSSLVLSKRDATAWSRGENSPQRDPDTKGTVERFTTWSHNPSHYLILVIMIRDLSVLI